MEITIKNPFHLRLTEAAVNCPLIYNEHIIGFVKAVTSSDITLFIFSFHIEREISYFGEVQALQLIKEIPFTQELKTKSDLK